MTKEELKSKLISDPEARKKFITATADYYKSIGLSATKEDLAAISDGLEKAAKPEATKAHFPMIIIIILPYPGPPERSRI